jgi:2-polyprenyl-3-methyl-5-hydroxy-6-metoxy-1,4-benzoquinol methylase
MGLCPGAMSSNNVHTEICTETRGDFGTASASALPFLDKSFHTTICFEVLEHCHEHHMMLKEIARCTSDLLILSVPNCNLDNALRRYNLAMFHWTDRTHCNFFTKETIRSLLTQEGFTIIEMTDAVKISPNNYFWDTLRLPKRITHRLKKLCEQLDLVETYWSSILIVAQVPPSRSY